MQSSTFSKLLSVQIWLQLHCCYLICIIPHLRMLKRHRKWLQMSNAINRFLVNWPNECACVIMTVLIAKRFCMNKRGLNIFWVHESNFVACCSALCCCTYWQLCGFCCQAHGMATLKWLWRPSSLEPCLQSLSWRKRRSWRNYDMIN